MEVDSESFTKLSNFAKDTAKKYSIENQKKIIKEANLKNYSDIEESHGLHGNHITSGDGIGHFDNLTKHEIDKIILDNIWYLNHFDYHDVVDDSKFFERLLRWYGDALPTELANYE